MNTAPGRAGARYVLYWAQMNRRVDSNHALAYAALQANEMGLPLLFYEGLTSLTPMRTTGCTPSSWKEFQRRRSG
jgi:hypothetical protein